MATVADRPETPVERRNSARLRLVVGLPVHLGRYEGTLIDVGRGGARVRHSGAVRLESDLMLSFTSGSERFISRAQVVASHVVGLGASEGGATLFETAVRFTHTPAESIALIEQMVGSAGES